MNVTKLLMMCFDFGVSEHQLWCKDTGASQRNISAHHFIQRVSGTHALTHTGMMLILVEPDEALLQLPFSSFSSPFQL